MIGASTTRLSIAKLVADSQNELNNSANTDNGEEVGWWP